LAPVVHGLEQQWSGQINFVYLDIDDAATDPFKRQLGYNYQPHIFLLDGGGEVLQQWVGLVSGEELNAALAEVSQ
jgi:hypothetical protein